MCRSIALLMAFVSTCVVSDAVWAGPAEATKEYTGHDAYTEALAVVRRDYGDAYKDAGTHGAWDEAAAKFLDDWAVYQTYHTAPVVYRDVPVPTAGDLVRRGKALLADAHCTDPLVAACYGAALNEDNQPEAALPVLSGAAKSLAASQYPNAVTWLCAYRVARLDVSSDDAKAVLKISSDRAPTLANVRSATRGERLYAYDNVYAHASHLQGDERLAYMAKLRETAGADPWVVDVAEGRLRIDLAWEARGSGSARDVKRKEFDGFYEHLEVARDCLTRAWQLAPDIPAAAADEMITVAMGGGRKLGENPGVWWERAVAVQLDCRGAYRAMFDALLPRWGGSYDAMLDLGRRAARTGRYDTEAPWQLVEAFLKIVHDPEPADWSVLQSEPGLYDELVAVVDNYDRVAAKKGNTWYRTFRAALAWKAGRLADARRILDELDEAADLDAFRRVTGSPPAIAAADVYLMSGPQAEKIRHAEWAIMNIRLDDALTSLNEAKAAIEASAKADRGAAAEFKRTKPYFERMIEIVTRRQKLKRGDWTDLPPGPDFISWRRLSGVWTGDEKGDVTGRYGNRYTPTLLLGERVGQAFEIAGRAAHGNGDGRPAVYLRSRSGGRAWITIFEKAVVLQVPGMPNKSFPRERSAAADFLVRFEHGKLNVFVGGKPVIADHDLPERLAKGVSPGLAFTSGSKGTATFSKLRVRALEPELPGEKNDDTPSDKPVDPDAPPQGL